MFYILPWVILGVALVCFLFAYGGLPERIGVHFGHDGDFDVIAEKIFGFYPFAAGFGLMLLFTLGGHFAGKLKTGLKLAEGGDRAFRAVIKGYACILCWVWSVFFTRWTYSVITQTPNNIIFLTIISWIFLLSVPALVAAIDIVRIKYRIK